jgi:hypothetical protein
MPRLDKHDGIHHQLFDENTNQIGNLGDIVEAHAGDAVFLTPAERSKGGVDGGESDFTVEMLETDPADEEADPDDLYASDDQVWSTDQTGTVEGIARGFGTHLPQDLGRSGFHVEEVPDAALRQPRRLIRAGEELDDYDDKPAGDEYVEDELSIASQPGMNDIDPTRSEPTPGRIPIQPRRPRTFDEKLDASREIH